MRSRVLVALALAAVAGCVPRLSDPFFAFQDLDAPEALPGRSLVFGTIDLRQGFIGPGEVSSVVLVRVRPDHEPNERIATRQLPFRAFRDRQVKDGHFVLSLEPGAYELRRIVGDGIVAPELVVDEDGRRATRFTITRPAVVDLGVLHVAPGIGLATYSLTFRASSDPGRAALLRATIEGTPWERLPVQGVQR